MNSFLFYKCLLIQIIHNVITETFCFNVPCTSKQDLLALLPNSNRLLVPIICLSLTSCLGFICPRILRIDSPSDRPSKSIYRMLALSSRVSDLDTHLVGTSTFSVIIIDSQLQYMSFTINLTLAGVFAAKRIAEFISFKTNYFQPTFNCSVFIIPSVLLVKYQY